MRVMTVVVIVSAMRIEFDGSALSCRIVCAAVSCVCVCVCLIYI